MPSIEQLRFRAARLAKAARSGELRRGAVFKLAGRYGPMIVVDRGDGAYLVPTQDMAGLKTFMLGHYELDVMRAGIEQLTKWIGHDPLRDRVMIEVGANMGTTTIPAVREFGAAHVLAIEPNHRNTLLLRANVVLNEIDDRVTVVEAAVSDQDGVVEMEISPDSIGDHRVRQPTDAPAAMGEERRATVEVRSRRLDDLVDEHVDDLERIGLVWMDIQGHEGHALAGAKTLIEAKVPVLIEYWPYGLERAGGVELLQSIMGDFGRVVDIRHGTDGRELTGAEIARLPTTYVGFNDYTDLLLIP